MQDESRIMLRTWLFQLLLVSVSVPAAHLERFRRDNLLENAQAGEEEKEDKPCQDREVRNRAMLGGLMLKSGVLSSAEELQEQSLPNITFLEFSFRRPVLVRGWTLKGRSGGMFGPQAKRRGFVASYVVTYETDKGDVQIINDPDSKEEEFVSEGNLANPESVTDVDLEEGVRTRVLRMAPIVWSGVPFMAAKVFVCAKDHDLSEKDRKAEDKEDEDADEDLSVKEMEGELKKTRTANTLTAAVDATKAAMGIKPAKTEDEAFVEKPPHLPFTQCLQQPSWRYASKLTPVDHFSARGNPQQAWRAILGVAYPPYLFPTAGPKSHHHQLLEIVFRNRSHVTAVKMGGLGEAGEDDGRWGAVTKFSLLYKDPITGSWIYYADGAGTPRVFTVGERTRTTAQKVGVFHLPVPLTTDALGIFPHQWINKPYLAIDILACYMRGNRPRTESAEEDTGSSTTTTSTTTSTTTTTTSKVSQTPSTKEEERKKEKPSNTAEEQKAPVSQIYVSKSYVTRPGSTEEKLTTTPSLLDEDTEAPEEPDSEEVDYEDEIETEDTQLEETADLEGPFKNNTDGEKSDDGVLDEAREAKELKDITKEIEAEQKQIEALAGIPDDMKAEMKNQGKGMEQLVSKIQKGVSKTVANTKLQPKKLKAPKNRRKKKPVKTPAKKVHKGKINVSAHRKRKTRLKHRHAQNKNKKTQSVTVRGKTKEQTEVEELRDRGRPPEKGDNQGQWRQMSPPPHRKEEEQGAPSALLDDAAALEESMSDLESQVGTPSHKEANKGKVIAGNTRNQKKQVVSKSYKKTESKRGKVGKKRQGKKKKRKSKVGKKRQGKKKKRKSKVGKKRQGKKKKRKKG